MKVIFHGSRRVIVCLCFAVSEHHVRARARDGASLAAVLEETGAGSSCGACRLAIARIHAGEPAAPAPCRAGRAPLAEAAWG